MICCKLLYKYLCQGTIVFVETLYASGKIVFKAMGITQNALLVDQKVKTSDARH